MSIEVPERGAGSAEHVGTLLDAAIEACVVMDAAGQIADWNPAAESLFGWSLEETLGRDMAQLIFPDDARGEYIAAASEVTSGRGRPGARWGLRAAHRTGAALEIELALGLLAGDEPRLVAFVVDVSERRQAAARQQQFAAIIASSGDAIFSGPFDGTIESWNPAAERLYGYSAQEMIGSSVTRLLPGGSFDDVKPQREALRQGRSISLEVQERRKDGRLVDVALTISPLRDDAGEVAGVVSVVRDIGERIQAAKQLSEAHARFAAAFEAASIGMALVAPDGAFLEVNPALCSFLDRSSVTLLTQGLPDVIHPDDLAGGHVEAQRALDGEVDSFQYSQRYLLPDGGIVWGLSTSTLVSDGDGAPRHFVLQIQNITDRKTAEGELRRYATQLEALSEKDPLTGLLNQRAFKAALGEELRVLDAGGATCTVLLVAVDGDDDDAVTAAADLLAGASRDTDQLAHLGEGELAILLPHVDETAAGPIVTRIQDALAVAPGGNIPSAHATGRPGDTVRGVLDRIRVTFPHEDAASPAGEFGQTPAGIARLLELARRQLGMPISFLSRVDRDNFSLERFAGDHGQLGIAEGDTMPLSATHCQRMLDGRIGSTVADLAAEPETRDLNGTQAFGLRAYAGVPVRLRSGEIYGTLCTIDTQPHPELTERHAELLRFLSDLAGELIEDETEQRTARRSEARASGVRTLLVALEARDFYTSEHSKDVVDLATAVSRRLGLDQDATNDIKQVALLHDIGKVGIPDSILQKQGPLDEQEWQLMRQHPIVGEHIIAGTPGLSHLAPAMRAEHERWDGNGYPDRLAGEHIPLASRITLACDALNAMTTNRPYRPAMSLDRAREELQLNAGTQFDPQVIEALLAEIDHQTVRVQSSDAEV